MTERLDQRLVTLGLARSRAQAQALIKAGQVSLAGKVITKASHPCTADDTPTIKSSELTRYVSRGGLKLQGALHHTGIKVQGLSLLDMGQSTGGFTDCLLQAGAMKIVGVDVGRDQLDPQLRSDLRVTCLEGINGRDLPTDALLANTPKGGFDGLVMDVSFISQTLILPKVLPLVRPGGFLLSLVKPQFELQPEQIGKGGIVRDEALYPLVEQKISTACQLLQWQVRDYFASPIEGGDGNREFFIYATR